MKKPIPQIIETPIELTRRLDAQTDARKHQRVQALYLLQTRPARPRRQVARWLAASRHTVGRWPAAYEAGGITQLLTIITAPGKSPLVPPAVRQALRQRLTQPAGWTSDKAIWQWRQPEYGLALAYPTVHRLVRYQLRAKLKVPRKSQIKKSCRRRYLSGAFSTHAAGHTPRGPGGAPYSR
jgi:transposase